jgi:hypothetical protein
MSSGQAPKPIVTPGPTPEGPPGWEEKQQKRLASGDLTNEKQSSNYHDDIQEGQRTDTGSKTASHEIDSPQGGMAKVKSKIHKIGEKMALVPPTEGSETGNAMERSAHRQVSCTVLYYLVAYKPNLNSDTGSAFLGCFHDARMKERRISSLDCSIIFPSFLYSVLLSSIHTPVVFYLHHTSR